MKKKKAKKLDRKAMKTTKGGSPVARYHLENAWPSKQEPPPELKGN
jgi:hypothetical protein